jgi:hypothetical protein
MNHSDSNSNQYIVGRLTESNQLIFLISKSSIESMFIFIVVDSTIFIVLSFNSILEMSLFSIGKLF